METRTRNRRARHSSGGLRLSLGLLQQRQGRHAEAEAAYRRALDIFLELGNQEAAADAYYQLGRLSQQQQHDAEAAICFRQALDALGDTDDRQAWSAIATRIGIALAQANQHQDATTILLQAAITWHQQTGRWDPQDLTWLVREREQVDPSFFAQQVSAHVPDDMQDEFSAALDMN
jgi:tetratricopeptide (TPR) repeat protein